MMAANPMDPVLDKVRETLRAGHGIWLVGSAHPPPGGKPQPVYPPYSGDPAVTEDMYFSSWMYQVTYLVQQHILEGGPVPVPVPDGVQVNPLENVGLVYVHGWRD
jgi:hypothetical protein